ncbi:MAG: flavodoxin domain-containing protein [Candidatus Methanomethylophilaceae archaeon]
MATAVIYASKTGSTEKAAEYIASKINGTAINVKQKIDPTKYDRIIIGSGVYGGKPAKAISEFVRNNKTALTTASLFLCCMFDKEKGDRQLEKIADELGIADAIYFNKVKSQIGDDSSKLGTYISSLV